jgi:pyruvate dehydrogenase (quinone)
MMASLSGNLATMGPAVPYAIAGKFTNPDRPVVAFVGDGAMQMNGNAGLITIAKYWQQWDDPRLVICVLNNGDLNQVTWEQRVMEGDPKFEGSQNVPNMAYADYARMLGLEGVAMREPEDIVPAWKKALRADRPCVIDAHVDPEVPPLPPHIRFDQAKKYMFALLRGDPNRDRMIKQSFRQKLGGPGSRE